MQNTNIKTSKRLGKTAYPFRLMGYYFGFTTILIHHGGFDGLTNASVVFLSLVALYPHLGYFYFRLSGNRRQAEHHNLTVDAFLLGGFFNVMNFALVPTMVFATMIIASHAVLRGISKIWLTFIMMVLGIFISGLFNGFELDIVTNNTNNILSTASLCIFCVLYSYLGYVRYSALREAKLSIRKKNEELESKQVQLDQINKEKDFLIGIAAHDLKSPLNQIIALIQIIELSTTLDDKQKENLNYIVSSANKMRNLISKILDVHAIETGDFNFAYENFDLVEVVKSVYQSYVNVAEFKNIELEVDYYHEPCMVNLDKSYLIQIIDNLVSNAIKFTEPGEKVFLVVTKNADLIQLKVIDEGPGISQEEQKMLFNKFQKLSPKPTGNEPSTGLGLAIVKKFTEAMNGRVHCKSEPGKGSTFFLEFKASQVQKKVEQ